MSFWKFTCQRWPEDFKSKGKATHHSFNLIVQYCKVHGFPFLKSFLFKNIFNTININKILKINCNIWQSV